MFTKGQSGELAWVTSSNIPSPLKWFLRPFSDFASSLKCFMKRIKILLDIHLHQEHIILEGGGLQLPKIGGGQREHNGGML